RRVVVAVLGDAQEEDAVPARPDIRCIAELVQERRVPPRRVRMPVRLEPEKREDRSEPDPRARPEEDAERWVPRLADRQLARSRARSTESPTACARSTKPVCRSRISTKGCSIFRRGEGTRMFCSAGRSASPKSPFGTGSRRASPGGSRCPKGQTKAQNQGSDQ